jgi:hypothetical protein
VEGGSPENPETKKRGMSDIDESNLKQLQENTSHMIGHHIKKRMSSSKLVFDLANADTGAKKSTFKATEEKKGRHGVDNDEDDSDKDDKMVKPTASDDEFFECFDDQKDLHILENNIRHRGLSENPDKATFNH